MDRVLIDPGYMSVKREVCFTLKLVRLTGPLRTDIRQTDRQTHIERKQYLCHSVHSLSGNI